MTALEENLPDTGATPSDSIVRLVRRICLLREQGRAAEAKQLENTELPIVLKGPEASGRIGTEQLAQLYRIEAERAANAVILSELIVTQLDGRLPRAAPSGRAAFPTPSRSPIPSAPETAGGPPAIPDLLDAMLAHDRSAARRHSASGRPGAGNNNNPTTRST